MASDLEIRNLTRVLKSIDNRLRDLNRSVTVMNGNLTIVAELLKKEKEVDDAS